MRPLPALACALLLACALGPQPASAQPSVGARIDETSVRFTTNETALLWINATLDGGAARALRLLADTNFSGNVDEGEAQAMADTLRRTLLDESPELAVARSSLLLDGAPPADTGEPALRLDGLVGARGSREPAAATLTSALTWNATTATNDTRELRIPAAAVVAAARVTIAAPPGLLVNATEGLANPTLAEEGRAVTGTSTPGRDVAALFAPPPPPPDAATDEREDARDVPMGGAALVALAAAALAFARRRP